MPNLDIVFTTKGVSTLLSSLTKIGKQFDALDKKANTFKGFSKGANTLMDAAKILDRSSSALNKAANNLKVSAAMLSKATGGKPLTSATGGAGGTRRSGNQKSWGQMLKNLVYSTRFGNTGKGGAGVFPLIGRVLPLIEKLGPIGMAAAGIGAAALAIGELGRQAAELGAEFSKMRFALGSSPARTAQLSAEGTAIQLSGSDMASIAASIQSHITGDPYGRAMGLGMGIQNISGPFGDPDWGRQLQTVIDKLRAIPNWTQRVIAARTLGADGLLPITQLSEKQYGLTQSDAAFKAQIFTPEMGQKSADLLASLGRVGDGFKNILAALGTGTMDRLTDWANQFANWLNDVSLSLSQHANFFRGLMDMGDAIQKMLGAPAFKMKTWSDFMHGMNKAGDEIAHPTNHLVDHLNANAQATQANTDALIQLNGTFGRGERADRAMPSGMNGQFLREALTAGGIRLSQF